MSEPIKVALSPELNQMLKAVSVKRNADPHALMLGVLYRGIAELYLESCDGDTGNRTVTAPSQAQLQTEQANVEQLKLDKQAAPEFQDTNQRTVPSRGRGRGKAAAAAEAAPQQQMVQQPMPQQAPAPMQAPPQQYQPQPAPQQLPPGYVIDPATGQAVFVQQAPQGQMPQPQYAQAPQPQQQMQVAPQPQLVGAGAPAQAAASGQWANVAFD